MSGDALLRVRGLRKRFGRQVVLDGIDLTVNAGELVALVGENAAGKSTLVRCIAGDLAADAGSVELVDGRPPAVVWQDLALCENLSAAANLFLGRELGGVWLSDSDMERQAAALLDELGIDLPDVRRPVGWLSGGQRQSLAIARALVGRPRLLILDEPTASLGVLETRSVERVLLTLRNAGCGLLLVSHRIEQVFAIADRVVVLRHGQVAGDHATTELHPDDVVSLMAGIETESAARKQMQRLRSLVDQLAGTEPSASVPLIVSALAVAVGAAQICVHLLAGDTLTRRAAHGVRSPLVDALTELPVGPAGGVVGLAAQGTVVVTEDVASNSAWATQRDAAVAAGVRSAWAVPIHDGDGVLGVISIFAQTVGRPQPAMIELGSMYAALASAAIQRERLLVEITRRNQILESLRGMLDTLSGPQTADDGVRPALSALRDGLRAERVTITASAGVIVASSEANHPAVEQPDAAARRSVPLASDAGAFRLDAEWASEAAVTEDALDLLLDAARSLSLALEREEVTAARLETESLRHAQRTQRDFLSRLSHELRTPLTAIHGYASTLRQTDVDWDQASERRFLGVIVDESARMGRLVADLLDSSTIESGGLRIDPDWCELDLAIQSAASCVPELGDALDVTIDERTPRVWADHDRFEQVLVNVLENAIRHGATPVTVTASPGARGFVQLTVTDSGPGFPPDVLDRALEPYARGEASAPGAGLGLAVCRGIVEAHGGGIVAGNDANHGTVNIMWPTEPSIDSAADPATGAATPSISETDDERHGDHARV